jgi:hypothetical protein
MAVGDIKSIKGGSSMALNNQAGCGGHKPCASGKDSPGGTKPAKPADTPVSVPMPK